MSDEKIIIKQASPVYGTLSIIFGFIGIILLISGIASGFVAYYAVMNLLK